MTDKYIDYFVSRAVANVVYLSFFFFLHVSRAASLFLTVLNLMCPLISTSIYICLLTL